MFAKVDGHLDAFAEARGELVDGVINHLLDEDIDAVVVRGSVAKFADIHTRAEPDVLHVFEVYDSVVAIFGSVVHRQGVVFFHCAGDVFEQF